MARITEEFKKQYSTVKFDEINKPIIFVVDMINGFIKTGALHDEAIISCVTPIQNILEVVKGPSIFFVDAHPTQSREFNSFPTHCVKGSSESEIIDELQPFVKTWYYKNSTNAFFSPKFQAFLQKDMKEYQDIIIVGCCSDICILQFALSLNAYFNEHNEMSKQIFIPLDAIDTYHIEGVHDAQATNEFAIANMQANGIQIVNSISRGDDNEKL